jgi:microsomal dipeptidase-like Zn-dependent dipeptidase
MAGQRARRLGRIALVALALALLAFFWAGSRLERFVNRVEPVPLPEISERALALHRSSFVVDLHADSLLFERDLLRRSEVGHVDLPRLQEGGVGLQVFAMPTVVPLGADLERTDPNTPDVLTLAGLAQRSPFAWRGPMERALLQSERLGRAVAAAGGQIVPVHGVEDLERLVALRAEDPRRVGALLAVEGAHALEGDPENLERLFAAGVRAMGLAHFFDNAYAGSAHGQHKGGLSELGRATLRRMEELGIAVDLAHLSPRAIEETLDLVTRPVIVSHGGVKGTCDNLRNLSDAEVVRVAENGGVIGIGYWDWAICGTSPRDFAAAVRHVVDLVGPDHVGLGSDYDGGTTVGFDTSELPALTQALVDAGFDDETIRKVLGGNALRVLRATLPRRASGSAGAP